MLDTPFPPTTRTFPDGSSAAAWKARAVARLPVVAVNVPVVGSYSSAEATYAVSLLPPASRTFPVDRSVAVWECRAVARGPFVAVKVPVAGS